MLSVLRLRQRASLFAALFGVVLIVSALGVGLIGYLENAGSEGTRVEMASRTGADVGFMVSLARSNDPETQDERMRSLLAKLFTSNGRVTPIEVDRTLAGGAAVDFTVTDPDAPPTEQSRVVVMSLPALADRATLVDGAWPTRKDEVSVQADAAQLLGVKVGSGMRLGKADVTVAAIWRVENALDPRWLGDQIYTSGVSGLDAGPIVMDETEWAATGADPQVRWTVTTRPAELTSADLPVLFAGWNDAHAAMADDGSFDLVSYSQRGRLGPSALEVLAQVNALHALEPVAILIIAAIGLVTLVELARVLSGLRSAELLLLWSRGATATELAAATAAEAAAVSLGGAAVGAASACAILYATGGLEAATSVGSAVWWMPVAVACAATAILAVGAFVTGRALSRSEKPDEAGRARTLGGIGAVVLVGAGAGLSVWQLLLYGSPVTPSANGSSQVDPVAVLAPALALTALVLLALVVVPLVAPLLERRAARSRGVGSPLIARTLARRLRLAATPLVLTALACGQFVIAAGYSQTWDDSFTVTRALRTGAELRLATDYGLPLDRMTAIAETPGVSGVAPVWEDRLGIGAEEGTIIAVAPEALRTIGTTASGMFHRDSVAKKITGDLPGTELSREATTLRVEVALHLIAVLPHITVVLTDPLGNLTRAEALPEPAPTPLPDAQLDPKAAPLAYSVSLPDPAGLPQQSAGGWRLVGFEVGVEGGITADADSDDLATFEVTKVTEAGAAGDPHDVKLDPNWEAWRPGLQPIPVRALTAGVGFIADRPSTMVRLLPTLAPVTDHVIVPIAVARSVAINQSVKVGDVLRLTLDSHWEQVSCVVTAIVPAVPASSDDTAILVDIGWIQALQLRIYTETPPLPQAWVSSRHPSAVAAALRPQLPAGVLIDTLSSDPSRGVLESASRALWVSAVGAALLAIVAFASVVGAQLRSRRREVVVLRALGIGARQLSGMRRWELAVVIAIGLVVGAIAGLVVTFLVVPTLARAEVAEPYDSLPTVVAFAPVGLAVGLATFVALEAIVVGVYGIVVARQVRQLSSREVLE